ncbi:MAG: hypothetical protein IPK80_07355 [Nannocystis sp.]|nr:hypothetical protein [Nannocystis sp.]
MRSSHSSILRPFMALVLIAACSDSSGGGRGDGGGFDSWNLSTGAGGDATVSSGGGFDDGEAGSGGSTGAPAPAVCGDGVVAGDEACDDGPANGPGQACRLDCTANVCGDGEQGPGEACDDGPANAPDGACSAACTVNPSACGTVEVAATIEKQPLDVILVVDNSSSMKAEIAGIQDNINDHFAAILSTAGIDYTMVVVSKYGNYKGGYNAPICIEAPLGEIPPGGCVNPPSHPGSTETFSHYSTMIGSDDAWCKILKTGIGVDDEFDQYGWMKWLRKDAHKAFIIVSDDHVGCTLSFIDGKWDGFADNQFDDYNLSYAERFDEHLRTLSPSKFGALTEERKYTVHSLIGLAASGNGEPYPPSAPFQLGKCSTAEEPGTGHQALSKLTGGLRFPVCDTNNYDKVFQALADSMIKGAKITCDFPVPPPPEGKTLDPSTIAVNYYPMGQQDAPESFSQVATATECAPGLFYLAGETIHLCPDTCAAVQQDFDAEIKVEFSCLPVTPG